MKIVHINLAMGYTEGLSYQENCETKYHAQAGHEVTVLTTPYCFNDKGEWGPCTTSFDYINSYGVHIIRLPFALPLPYNINRQIGLFKGTAKKLKELNPDVICVHNAQFQDLRTIIRYKKKYQKVKIFLDNHADFSNSARTWFTRNILYRLWWAPCARTTIPYTEKYFGVMPSRIDFMINVYGIPRDKCELLYMGAEDEEVQDARKPETIRTFRSKFGIKNDDFLIMTGGKIDAYKTQPLLLMEAILKIKKPRVRLIVFGSIDDTIREKFNLLVDGVKVQYIGWAKGNQSYHFFAAANLVVFPGRHSVYWEQVAGLGIPMICRYWEGTTHVDLGGNVVFLREDSTEHIVEVLDDLLQHPEKIDSMKEVAIKYGMREFSYKNLSERAIGN